MASTAVKLEPSEHPGLAGQMGRVDRGRRGTGPAQNNLPVRASALVCRGISGAGVDTGLLEVSYRW